MRPVSFTKALTAGSATAVAGSQSPASAGNLTLTATPVVLTSQRRIILTSGGDDHLLTATVTGTNQYGNTITQTISLTNGGVAATTLDFLTVTQISVSGAVATTIEAGTNTTGSSQWVMPSFHLTPFLVTIDTQLTGSVTYSIETTNGDYWDYANPTTVVPVTSIASGLTATTEQPLNTPCTGFRVTITSGTGTLTVQATQAGIANY